MERRFRLIALTKSSCIKEMAAEGYLQQEIKKAELRLSNAESVFLKLVDLQKYLAKSVYERVDGSALRSLPLWLVNTTGWASERSSCLTRTLSIHASLESMYYRQKLKDRGRDKEKTNSATVDTAYELSGIMSLQIIWLKTLRERAIK